MKRFYSLKHAKSGKEKLAKCNDHYNSKILVSAHNKTPLLIKEDNSRVLHTHINYPELSVNMHNSDWFSDTYKELPPGTTVVFTQDSLS